MKHNGTGQETGRRSRFRKRQADKYLDMKDLFTSRLISVKHFTTRPGYGF